MLYVYQTPRSCQWRWLTTTLSLVDALNFVRYAHGLGRFQSLHQRLKTIAFVVALAAHPLHPVSLSFVSHRPRAYTARHKVMPEFLLALTSRLLTYSTASRAIPGPNDSETFHSMHSSLLLPLVYDVLRQAVQKT